MDWTGILTELAPVTAALFVGLAAWLGWRWHKREQAEWDAMTEAEREEYEDRRAW